MRDLDKNHQNGFTLVELAIVLVIIGVLLGGFIGTFASRIEGTRVANTKENLDDIKEILIGYAYSKNAPYLPCPDCISLSAVECIGFGTDPLVVPRDGIEDRDETNDQCSVGSNIGSLPWVTLGLSGGDAWGNRYHYWVDSIFSDSTPSDPGPPTIPDDYFDLTTLPAANTGNGALILERTANGAATQTLASRVVAVIISQGKNGYGGTSTSGASMPAIPGANVDETDNVNDDEDFVSRSSTNATATTAGGEFDDIVVWISEYELKAKMVEAGALP